MAPNPSWCDVYDMPLEETISIKGIGQGGNVTEQQPGKMEKAKGLAKEVAGTVIRNEGMRAQGRAQRQEPAEEGLKRYFRKVIEESNLRAAGKG